MTQWGLDALFNPGKRHMDEEKLRLQSTREEVGDSSGGKRIDLDSGKVSIRKSGTRRAPVVDHPMADEPVADEPVAADADPADGPAAENGTSARNGSAAEDAQG